ncbi:MAG: hypothetical protein HC893_08990 [Chloroflexaceae bacterium]|nr:hypothetical protein [Chloroflexaceae bacterium]
MPLFAIELPDDTLALAGLSAGGLQQFARETVVVRLYEQGRVTSGWLAAALSLAWRAALDVISSYGVSIFAETMDDEKSYRPQAKINNPPPAHAAGGPVQLSSGPC